LTKASGGAIFRLASFRRFSNHCFSMASKIPREAMEALREQREGARPTEHYVIKESKPIADTASEEELKKIAGDRGLDYSDVTGKEMFDQRAAVMAEADADGGLWFFFIDAVEDDRADPPRCYLFGKVRTSLQNSEFSSCCLVVEQLERCVHFLLNVPDDDEDAAREKAAEAEAELEDICRERCPGFRKLRAKLKWKNYAFEKANLPQVCQVRASPTSSGRRGPYWKDSYSPVESWGHLGCDSSRVHSKNPLLASRSARWSCASCQSLFAPLRPMISVENFRRWACRLQRLHCA